MLDRLDAKILNLVQRNNRLTVEQIGHKVGLSASACQRRLRRLRADKVIREEVAVVDPAKVVRAALQDAASVAGLLITTEAMVADKPEKNAPAMPGGAPDMGGMDF